MKALLTKIDRETWTRFFLALAGLALAFASAVFSSAASEAGNVVATAVFASLALLLAAVVGVLTVPYLFRRVVAARDHFQYEFTREGTIYLVAAVLVGIAALNTANNLLFIILAAMLSAVWFSGVGSAANLRGLELAIDIPSSAFAKRPVAVRVSLQNPRLWMPSFSVTLDAPRVKKKKKPGWEWQKSEFTFPKRQRWVRLPDYKLRRKALPEKPPKVLTRPIYFAFIAARSAGEAHVELVFPRRGYYGQESFILSTRFPFSFLIKSRKVALESKLVVYPPLMEPEDLLDVLPLVTGEFASFVRGRGTELYRIRDHAPDDMARYVDWKATAKTGSLKVREFTLEDERRLRVVFDNAEPGQVALPAYEHAVSLAATLACHFHDENVDLSFAGAGYDGPQDLDSFLRYLALVEPRHTDWTLEMLPATSDFNLIITARNPVSIPGQVWDCSYVIYM